MKKLAEKINCVGLVANTEKAACRSLVQKAASLIEAANKRVILDAATAQLTEFKGPACPDVAALTRAADLLMVFGGDGTMLRVAREAVARYYAERGAEVDPERIFLTTSTSEAYSYLFRLLPDPGDRVLVPRPTGRANGRAIKQTALNDIVMSRGIESRLIELDVRVDGELLTRYRCDGLIVSSPTGSTAYSLAAGGAVIFPTTEVLALTPICPHTLSNRALVLPLTSTIEVRVITPKLATILSADGQVLREMFAGDQVTIRRSSRAVRLMHLAGTSFCETLRRKLHWRGTPL